MDDNIFNNNSETNDIRQGGDNNPEQTSFILVQHQEQQTYQEQKQSCYTEDRKKSEKKGKPTFWQLLLVAVMSAILGGGVVFSAFAFLAPAIGPSMQSILGVNSENGLNSVQAQADNSNMYKRIEITEYDSAVTAIAEKVSPSIVGIKVTLQSRPYNFFFEIGGGVSEGSGIIIREDGYILTNNHVIQNA
jgi:serine protease Do